MEYMKILISIIMALFLLGCSDYGTEKAQQNEPQEAVGEMPDETQRPYEELNDEETFDIPMVEEENMPNEEETVPDQSMTE